LAYVNIAIAAMALRRTGNFVAGLGYFWAISQLLDHYRSITAEDDNAV